MQLYWFPALVVCMFTIDSEHRLLLHQWISLVVSLRWYSLQKLVARDDETTFIFFLINVFNIHAMPSTLKFWIHFQKHTVMVRLLSFPLLLPDSAPPQPLLLIIFVMSFPTCIFSCLLLYVSWLSLCINHKIWDTKILWKQIINVIGIFDYVMSQNDL